MTAAKAKGFSFTIDSLINSQEDDRPGKAIFRDISIGCYMSSRLTSSVDLKYWTTDEKVNSDKYDRMSPIPTSEAYIGTHQNLSLESEKGPKYAQVRCSTPYSEQTDIPRSSPGYSESSPKITNCRYKKKSRTAFTNEQLGQLEKRFRSQRYVSTNERSDLAEELTLTDQQIKTWFQNRRMKEKRQQKMEHTPRVPFPTGGVDVRQLLAFGIPCPIPPPVPTYRVQVSPSMPIRPFPQVLSQITTPHLLPPSHPHATNIHYLPHFGQQYGFAHKSDRDTIHCKY